MAKNTNYLQGYKRPQQKPTPIQNIPLWTPEDTSMPTKAPLPVLEPVPPTPIQNIPLWDGGGIDGAL